MVSKKEPQPLQFHIIQNLLDPSIINVFPKILAYEVVKVMAWCDKIESCLLDAKNDRIFGIYTKIILIQNDKLFVMCHKFCNIV